MTGTDRHSFVNPRPCVRGDAFPTVHTAADWYFNPRPCVRGDKRCLFGQQSDGSRKPHRKGVLLPVLAQLQQGSRASSLTAGVRASNCLCSDSGSNNAGSRLHSPSYRASNSGSIVPPLDFCRPVCYHRFSSVSALCWVVSVAVCRRALTALFFALVLLDNPITDYL